MVEQAQTNNVTEDVNMERELKQVGIVECEDGTIIPILDLPKEVAEEEYWEMVREAAIGPSVQARILQKLEVLARTPGKDEPVPTMEAVNSYLESHKNTGSSEKTIAHYRGVLVRFAKEYPELPLEPAPIEAFLSQWKGATQANYLNVVRWFYNFLLERGRISTNPTKPIRRPKAPTKLLPSLDREELGRLLSLLPDRLSERDRAYIMLSVDTGLRVGEVINLTFSCIDQDTLKVPEQGKTGERLVPLKPEVRGALLALKNGRKDTDPIFWNDHLNCPIRTEPSFLNIVRKAFEKAGIKGKRASPHTLRHTFARNWIANGGDIISLMRILGHKNIATTQKYVYQVVGDLVEKHRKHGPLAGLEVSLSCREDSLSGLTDSIPQ